MAWHPVTQSCQCGEPGIVLPGSDFTTHTNSNHFDYSHLKAQSLKKVPAACILSADSG